MTETQANKLADRLNAINTIQHDITPYFNKYEDSWMVIITAVVMSKHILKTYEKVIGKRDYYFSDSIMQENRFDLVIQ